MCLYFEIGEGCDVYCVPHEEESVMFRLIEKFHGNVVSFSSVSRFGALEKKRPFLL